MSDGMRLDFQALNSITPAKRMHPARRCSGRSQTSPNGDTHAFARLARPRTAPALPIAAVRHSDVGYYAFTVAHYNNFSTFRSTRPVDMDGSGGMQFDGMVESGQGAQLEPRQSSLTQSSRALYRDAATASEGDLRRSRSIACATTRAALLPGATRISSACLRHGKASVCLH